jgi:hypothetical protein
MIKPSLALIISVVLGLAANSRAELTWDWSYTSTQPGIDGSGTFTTDPLSGGGYTVTGITGTFNGYDITGLDSSVVVLASADQTLYTPGHNGLADNGQLSQAGIGFDTTEGGSGQGALFDYMGATDVEFDLVLGHGYGVNFTATQVVPTPEPSQAISMLSLAGMGGASLLLRLHRRK